VRFNSKFYSILLIRFCVLQSAEEPQNAIPTDESLFNLDNEAIAKYDPQSYLLTRGDALPIESFEDATDPYLEGYIQALIDVHYTEFQVIVSVKDHKVYLSNLPNNALLSRSIVSFVEDVPGVKEVIVENKVTAEDLKAREIYVDHPQINGIWFPQSTVLFPPLIANPRAILYSAAYRFGDRVVGNSVAAVSFGDIFPIFRWKGVWCWCGDMQLDIEGAAWAVFNFDDVPDHDNHETCELVNADYYLGIPVTYAFDAWSFRARIYHISSHLGDEFMVNDHYFVCNRKNPSFEAIDFYTAYQFGSGIRFYFGPGVIIHSDDSFPMKTFYIDYGAEFRFLGTKLNYHRLYGTPFIAIDIENWQVRDWDFDFTIKVGYEFSKLQGTGRKMRLYADYHHGFSYEGQFFKERTSYGEVGLSWGF
jgi:Protein of unknown function (DUF1207)